MLLIYEDFQSQNVLSLFYETFLHDNFENYAWR